MTNPNEKSSMAPAWWVAIVVALLSALAVVIAPVISGWFSQQNTILNFHLAETATAQAKLSTFTPSVTPSPSPSVTLTPIPTSTLTATPLSCPYEGTTDDQTIRNLIEAEATASNTKDYSIIQKIFSPNALIRDDVSLKTWNGPHDRYANDLFIHLDFKDVEHFDILPVGNGINGNIATYVSGSKGFDSPIGAKKWVYFNNGSLAGTKFGSDQWRLEKDTAGCWLIIQFDLNAGNHPFP